MSKYKIKKHNRKKLANLLLKNYILLYFIMTIILFLSIVISSIIGIVLYFNTQETVLDTPYQIMQDDYTKIDTSKIEELNGYIEVLDENHKVIYRKGKGGSGVTEYTIEQYNNLIDNSYIDGFGNTGLNSDSNNYVYKTAYNKDKKFLLVISIPREAARSIYRHHRKLNPKYFFMLSGFTSLLVLLLGFLIYSRVSSRNFVEPLKILIEGARSISKGDYSARIDLKSQNEFGELRDAFNTMAEKIEIEKKLKEKSEEMRKRLILDISHDLKNPLANILGYSDFLLKNPNLSEEDKVKYLQVIQSNSERANNLITDLFEFSKLQDVDFKLYKKKEDICEFLRELIASYIPKMEEKEIIYSFDIPEENICLGFDKKHLDRALSNLLMNSIKYNPPHTRLYIRCFKDNNSVYIFIADNGIGIPKELQKDIFDPFVRVDESRNSKSGGTGLGLAITKSIIEMHGGSISLESDKNKGCKFIINLPLK